MAYATVFHVEAKNTSRGPYTANTKPSATQVTLYLEESRGWIDHELVHNGYSPPGSLGASGLASSMQVLLQDINALGAAWMVEKAAQVSDRREDFQHQWQSALKMLRESELDLAQDTAESLPRYDDSAATAYFTRDMDL